MTDIRTGKPLIDGMYCCYIDGWNGWADKKILTWEKGEWWFHQNTAKYVLPVYGWIQLPALKIYDLSEAPKAEPPAQEFDL